MSEMETGSSNEEESTADGPTVLECALALEILRKLQDNRCPTCRQTHAKDGPCNRLHLEEALKHILCETPTKIPKSIKVDGLSNYHCKILSPYLTNYGMDKAGLPKLLIDLNRPEVFDCSILGSRAFLLDPEYMDVVGFGKDKTGSLDYLQGTLNQIYAFNNDRQCLIPIHADGDGHCLVHAISRALVGRELFWHPLRENLKKHFIDNQNHYKELFKDFIDTDEWDLIIRECQPNYVPLDGEPRGLRNIHVFGLANVLHRPIILLDSQAGMESLGDYTGVFLPSLVPVDECHGPDKSLNKPLCIAWSSSGRNHYIPLVALKDAPLPRLPRRLLPQVWGVENSLLDSYMEFDDRDSCVIGGNKCLKDSYIQRLAACMDRVFAATHAVQAADVADVHHYIINSSAAIDCSTPDEVIEYTRKTMLDHRLYRCLDCDAVSEFTIDRDWFVRGGHLYNVAVKDHGELRSDVLYQFHPPAGVTCDYDERTDMLVPDWSVSQMTYCPVCNGSSIRRILEDGTLLYLNGDRTKTKSDKCCGFKHWFNGREYDNYPQHIPVLLEWAGQKIVDEVYWFQDESDTSLNSNVYMEAQTIVQKHFPGEFGSERLVQTVVDTILAQTRSRSAESQTETKKSDCQTKKSEGSSSSDRWRADQTTKVILTGPKRKTFHCEELTMSETEREVKSRTERNAKTVQKRRTISTNNLDKSTPSSPVNSSSKKSEPDQRTAVQTPSKTEISEMKVKVETSDGRQDQLTLQPDTTFTQLQETIDKQFSIPANLQRIRYGFPPKELTESCPLPVKHGDKLLVEIVKVKQEVKRVVTASGDEIPAGELTHWFSRLAESEKAQRKLPNAMVESLVLSVSEKIQNLDINAVKEVYMNLVITCSDLVNTDQLWSILQKYTSLFEPGGFVYRMANLDQPMNDGFIFETQLLPGKRFRYNSSTDCCQVYVYPFGYYPVRQNVDDDVAVSHWRSSSDSINHWPQESFQGRGHTLRGQALSLDDWGDWENPSKNTSDWSAESWGSWGFKGEGRTLSDNKDISNDVSYLTRDLGKVEGFKRIGPGYSIIDTTGAENKRNEAAEKFQKLSEVITSVLNADLSPEEETTMGVEEGSSQPKQMETWTDSAGEEDMGSDGGCS